MIVVVAAVFAGCTILTDLDGLDDGSRLALDGGKDGPSATNEGGPLPDGSGSSSSSSSSSSGTVGDAATGGPCTVVTTELQRASVVATTGSGAAWISLDNAKGQNDVGAKTSLTGNEDESRAIVLSGFGFTIPSSAQIRGVTARFRAKATANTEVKEVRDERVQLTPNGSIAGSSLVGGQDEWASTYGSHESGGATSTWGLTLTPALITQGNFGVAYTTRFHANVGTDTATLELDDVQMSVTYCD